MAKNLYGSPKSSSGRSTLMPSPMTVMWGLASLAACATGDKKIAISVLVGWAAYALAKFAFNTDRKFLADRSRIIRKRYYHVPSRKQHNSYGALFGTAFGLCIAGGVYGYLNNTDYAVPVISRCAVPIVPTKTFSVQRLKPQPTN